jgi:hypothetical protein
MAYAKRYVGGFLDRPNMTTPADQQFLNAVETALMKLQSVDPSADGQVLQWDLANTRFGPALLLNKNVDPAAAIARSKLNFGAGLVDADIAAAAGIAASKIAAPYTSYTPAWTSTGTAPALLNGTITGRYVQIGKLVQCWGLLTMGSSTAFGTGAYLISFPVPPAQSRVVGFADMFHPSTGARHIATCEPQGGAAGAGSFAMTYPATWPAGANVTLGQTNPWAWASGDLLMWNLVYEAQ